MISKQFSGFFIKKNGVLLITAQGVELDTGIILPLK